MKELQLLNLSGTSAKILEHQLKLEHQYEPDLAWQITWLEYHRTTGSFGEKGEKQIPSSNISEAAGRCSTVDCSNVIWIHSKKVWSCIKGNWW